MELDTQDLLDNLEFCQDKIQTLISEALRLEEECRLTLYELGNNPYMVDLLMKHRTVQASLNRQISHLTTS